MKNIFERFGSFGAVIAAAACPVCFPKLALFGALFGLGALAPYETLFFFVAQGMVVMTLIAHVLSYKHQLRDNRGNKTVLVLSLGSGAVFFLSLYVLVWEYLSYLALLGLIGAAIWQIFWNRQCNQCETAA